MKILKRRELTLYCCRAFQNQSRPSRPSLNISETYLKSEERVERKPKFKKLGPIKVWINRHPKLFIWSSTIIMAMLMLSSFIYDIFIRPFFVPNTFLDDLEAKDQDN